ncbi:MAG: hypothetical protein JNJ70_03005 [Verrucomicrobiales bacterium]|nr:hypothetical protein [Verrucomicrobiales bacterium]
MITKLKSSLASLYESTVCKCTPCCHEMTRLISEAHERPHGWLLRWRMNLHYGICVWCLRYRDQLAMIRDLLRQFPGSTDGGAELLCEEARERIKESLRQAGEDHRP